jgi:HK97 family phage prohead protease
MLNTRKLLRPRETARAMQIFDCTVRRTVDGKKRFNFSLSSETPVARPGGKEILSHAPGAVRLDRAQTGRMPLLFNHNWSDPVGMVDSANVRQRRLNVAGNFFDTPRANEVASMVEGGLHNVSVGYQIHQIADEEGGAEDTYTATDWEPYEASIAPVPADPTVGVNRAAAGAVAPCECLTQWLRTPYCDHQVVECRIHNLWGLVQLDGKILAQRNRPSDAQWGYRKLGGAILHSANGPARWVA